jgi:methionine synthase II (cobalamin-independent)
MHWQDLLRPLTTAVKGVKKGAMVRWFNTNTFYFTPVVDGELLSNGRAVSRTLDAPLVKSGAITKVILPDPLTFVELAENSHYTSRERFIFAYCDNVLRPEVEHLSSMGIGYVQFSAPGLVARFRGEPVPRAELGQVGEGLRTVLKGVKVKSGYHTFFGDAAPYLPALFDLIPTDDFGFDFTETDPASLGASREGLIAGVADARSSYVESPGELVQRMGGLGERFRRITLAPSCDLQYVPRSVADAKLRNLATARLRLVGK